jgi:chemotaxis protein methyltransferase CheR
MLKLSGSANYLGARALRAPCLALEPLNFHHVVFPDLAGAGLRHVVNFAPPSVSPAFRERWAVSFLDKEQFCLRWFFRQAGLNVDQYRPETLHRRVPGLLRALEVRTLSEVVRANLRLLPKAMDALLIGVTSFFRDPDVVEALRTIAIPGLFAHSSTVRIWGAACSNGSELYSLAMLLAESGHLHRARLLGADCRASAVFGARRASFTADALRDVDPALVRRYFCERDGLWCISPFIQSRIDWRQADVLQETEPGEWDMILCRNFAIYLQPCAALRLWTRFHGALRRGGLLVTGKAERPAAIGRFRQLGPCLYQRKG